MPRTKAIDAPPSVTPPEPEAPSNSNYTVIARRYRPQRFDDVVGQDHVVQSLRNAIMMNRLGQAYLFAGTRGVGKTSIARIFAKCLNCVNGPTDEPDLTCDICQAIAVGQDIDVIEIDGASNNGVEQVRELRQNAGLRPSRARFKIYYIDEVHMLSTGAFNALLKTLEEPPAHVKFFFATTEPNKIPETVRSRCQRYDFAGITPEQAVATLGAICAREGVEAEPEALRAVARRGGGSMRDAQSLLEQLLSADGEPLTVELVHRRLGTASDERVLDLLDALADHDSAAVLRQVEQAAGEGVQPVELLNSVLEFLRDVMVLSAGGEGLLLAASPRQAPRLEKVVARWPLDSILAALQILAEARARLRGGAHGRLIVELALVKVARLENLVELGDLIARLSALESGGPAPLAEKKKAIAPDSAHAVVVAPPRPVRPVVPPPPPPPPLTIEDVRRVWAGLLKAVGTRVGFSLMRAEEYLAVSAPDTLAVRLPAGYSGVALECDTEEGREKVQNALSRLLKRPVSFRFECAAAGTASASDSTQEPASAAVRKREELEADPLVRKVVELFEARPLHLEFDDDASRTSPD